MRVLNEDEILKAMQTAHPEGEEYPKWNVIMGRLKREVSSVAQAQFKRDIKGFVEWLHEQGSKKSDYNLKSYDLIESLKQLVEE